MPDANERVIRLLVERAINLGQTDLIPGLVAADYVCHDHLGDRYGPEGARIGIAECRDAFPDVQVTVDDQFARDDRAACRFTLAGTHGGPFMGVPATGRTAQVNGIRIDRFADGRLVESWFALDVFGLLHQIGALPSLAGSRPVE